MNDQKGADYQLVKLNSERTGTEIKQILKSYNIYAPSLFDEEGRILEFDKKYKTVKYDRNSSWFLLKVRSVYDIITVVRPKFNDSLATLRKILKIEDGLTDSFTFLAPEKQNSKRIEILKEEEENILVLNSLEKNFIIDIINPKKNIRLVDHFGTEFASYECPLTSKIADVKALAEKERIDFLLEKESDAFLYNLPEALCVISALFFIPVFLFYSSDSISGVPESITPIHNTVYAATAARSHSFNSPECFVYANSNDDLRLLRTLINEKINEKGKTVSLGQFISENFTRCFVDDNGCVSEALWSLSNINTVLDADDIGVPHQCIVITYKNTS